MSISYTCEDCSKTVRVSGSHSFGFGGTPSVPCGCGGRAVMNGKHTKHTGKRKASK